MATAKAVAVFLLGQVECGGNVTAPCDTIAVEIGER
jgi:hypothetical protein